MLVKTILLTISFVRITLSFFYCVCPRIREVIILSTFPLVCDTFFTFLVSNYNFIVVLTLVTVTYNDRRYSIVPNCIRCAVRTSVIVAFKYL